MSRPMLYATLGVLLAILFGTSYALRKQTEPPPKPEEQATPEKSAAMREKMMAQEKSQKEAEQKKRKEMVKMEADKQKKEAAQLEAAAKANPNVKINKKKTSGVDISDKWFKETPDGPAGIEQAVKEKEALDKFNAAQTAAGKSAAPVKLTPAAPSK